MAAAAPAVAVVGETVVDVVAGSSHPRPGGSPANTAVALARLAVPVTLLARFADDDHGRLLRHHVTSAGVDLEYAVDAAGRSSVAHVVRLPDGSAAYEFDIDGAADWAWAEGELPSLPDSVVAIHGGSLALARSPVLERWLGERRAAVTVSIDPNLRAGLVDANTVGAVERWLSFTDLVKVSTDDLALLYPEQDARDVGRRWSGAGPGLVVVTAAELGAWAYCGSVELHCPARGVDVADTIGAGDAFTAGLLHALLERGCLGGRLDALRPEDVQAALEYATAVAALTCTRSGADPPTLGAVRAFVGS